MRSMVLCTPDVVAEAAEEFFSLGEMTSEYECSCLIGRRIRLGVDTGTFAALPSCCPATETTTDDDPASADDNASEKFS
jgi:hypothetical protein